MNMHGLVTPLDDSPDMSLITLHRQTIKQNLPDIERIYLPALKDELHGLSAAMSQSDKTALDALTLIPEALSGPALDSMLQPIETLKAQPQTPEVVEALASYGNEIRKQIENVVAKISVYGIALSNKLDVVHAIEPSNVRDLIEDTARRIASDQEIVNQTEAACQKLQAQEEVLSTAMRHLEDMSLIDDVLPLLNVIGKIDPKRPEVSAVLAAIRLLEQTLNLANNAIKYQTMVNRRHELQELVAEKKKQRDAYKGTHQEMLLRKRQLEAVRTISESKAIYVREMRKITKWTADFVSDQRVGLADDPLTSFNHYRSHSQDLASSLATLRRAWKY